MSLPANNEEEVFQPERLGDLDLTQWETVTPRYKRLPAAYPHPQLSEHADSSGVLNQECVSWIEKLKIDKKYEVKSGPMELEEDKRYESDMHKELLKFSERRLQEIMDGVKDRKIKCDLSFTNHVPAHIMSFLKKLRGIKIVEEKNRDMLRSILEMLKKELRRIEVGSTSLDQQGQSKRERIEVDSTALDQQGQSKLENASEPSRKRRRPAWASDYQM